MQNFRGWEMVESEKEFARFMESQGKTLIPQPKTFRYNGTSYRPDFYCMQDDTYYEVKTHLSPTQAIRLLKFKKFHPNIKFKIVSPNGYPYYSRSSGKCLAIIEKKLNLLKSRDILEISLDEFQENVMDFNVFERREEGNNLKNLRGNICMMEIIDETRKELGINKQED